MQHNELAPFSWDKFKVFLEKSLRESDAFAGQIWAKFKSDFQHQLEEVQDWATYLKCLKSILLEFDVECTPGEGQLGHTISNRLKPLIKL